MGEPFLGSDSETFHNRQLPKSRCRKASDLSRRSAPVSMPRLAIFLAVTGPTPWNRETGKRSTQAAPISGRSEEHTSELQSLMRISYAVLCLKQKLNIIQQHLRHHKRNKQHH